MINSEISDHLGYGMNQIIEILLDIRDLLAKSKE